MRIDCPYGHSTQIGTFGRLTSTFNDVFIFGGICDHSRICTRKSCRFHDDSEEAFDQFRQAKRQTMSTIEGFLEDRKKSDRLQRYFNFRIIDGKMDKPHQPRSPLAI